MFKMHMRAWFLILGFCSLSALDTCPEPIQESEPECCAEWLPDPKPELISASHTEGKGLGYTRGYTTLNLFLSQPFYQKEFVPFLDLRGHMFNDANYAANAGLGFRWLNCSWNQVWGVNCFYDYFETSLRPYNQVSAGLEILSETWGVQFNGYVPVGHRKTDLYEFSYLNISPDGFLVKGKEQFAMNGIDAEVGYRLSDINHFDFYAGAGPYYYWGNSAAIENAFRSADKHAVGGRLRASAFYRKYVSFEGIATYDSLFNWGGQMTLAITIPFDFTWDTGDCRTSYPLQERLYQPVRRNEIIVIDRINRFSSNPDILNPEFEP